MRNTAITTNPVRFLRGSDNIDLNLNNTTQVDKSSVKRTSYEEYFFRWSQVQVYVQVLLRPLALPAVTSFFFVKMEKVNQIIIHWSKNPFDVDCIHLVFNVTCM